MQRRALWVPICAGVLGLPIAPPTAVRAMTALQTEAGPAPNCISRIPVRNRSSSWAAPLNRIVTIDVPEASLREVIDHIARAAKIELSYSNELLPNSRRLCVSFDRVPVGAALETLLAETTLRAVVSGTTQVVLAPSRPVTPGLSISVESRRASVLDRVVVTGTPDGADRRGSPFALEVIDGAMLARQNAKTLGDALDLAVPGIWMWSATAGSLTARYGSVRGASSFGASAPKIYLDGIEVANPLLVTQIEPSRVERVEVIRGPQGAALYGADAISGVVNILTRHDGSSTGGTTVQFSSVAGVAATSYAPRDAFVQEHMAALRGGSGRRTYGFGVNVGTVGAYAPGASERRILAEGDSRLVFDNAVITGTGRISLQKANASIPLVGDSASGQDIRQFTLGATATVMPSQRWTHTIIAGVDGYRLNGLSPLGIATPTRFGGLGADARSGADRATLRARAVGRYDVSPRSVLTLTFAAEQAFTRELAGAQPFRSYVNVGGANFTATAAALPYNAVDGAMSGYDWGNSAGLTAQTNFEWNESVYLVAGVRAERSVGFTALPQNATLPLLGAAYVRDVHGVVFKLRTAYGTGIRPATSYASAAGWMGQVMSHSSATLQPESQTGTEYGLDVLMGKRLTVRATRFDQTASGLIQPVAGTSVFTTSTGRTANTVSYSLENVGGIGNQGWELQASTGLKQLTIAGSLSLVDSRVKQLAADYNGDLQLGDRMLDVPARTFGLSAMYTANRWSATTMVTRATDWVGYDRVRIGNDVLDSTRSQTLNGGHLRTYWLNYGGVTRWRANFAYRVGGDWSMLVGGDNLLNVQRGAPDNATITAGRTLTLGLRSGF